MSKPPKEVLETIIASLRNTPEDWSFSYGTARNQKLQTEIWMRNKYYGTHLEVGACRWGDVTMASTLFSSFMRWRKRLVRAAEFANLRQCLCKPATGKSEAPI